MNRFSQILKDHAESSQKLTIEQFTPDRRESLDDQPIENSYVRISGTQESLKSLGELLVEFASNDQGSTFDMHPNGAGTVHFTRGTNLGIFLVKTPCEEKTEFLIDREQP